MKTLTALLIGSLTVLSMEPAMASHQHHRHRECFETYERWEPGYYDSHGHYRRGRYVIDTRPTVCRSHHHHHTETIIIKEKTVKQPQKTHKPAAGKTDDNSCVEGSILGGIAGGGAGAALSRGDGRWWAIPLGIVGGAMVGCQIDGG